MDRIIIWGAGNRGKKIINDGLVEKEEVLFYIDNDSSKREIENITVHTPDYLKSCKIKYDYILISTYYFIEIMCECFSLNIDLDKVIIGRVIASKSFERNTMLLKHVFPKLYENEKKYPVGLVSLNESDYFDDNCFLLDLKGIDYDYQSDYFRYRTFELTARHLKDVDGAVAELGVYKGNFSRYINKLFPDRKLYLYDTFTGFNEKEANDEIAKGRATENFVKSHIDGSLIDTMDKIHNKEHIYIRKGFFPNTIEEMDRNEQFAFVSLDVDFEESTYQGLKFFYPRLSDGGMIFLHDYTTYFLSGVREAVNRYEAELKMKMKKISLADRAGTLVIIK